MLQFFQKLFYFHAYEFDYDDKHGYMNAANPVKYDSYNKVTKYKIMSFKNLQFCFYLIINTFNYGVL